MANTQIIDDLDGTWLAVAGEGFVNVATGPASVYWAVKDSEGAPAFDRGPGIFANSEKNFKLTAEETLYIAGRGTVFVTADTPLVA